MFHLWFCPILLDVKINLYQCQCQLVNGIVKSSRGAKVWGVATPPPEFWVSKLGGRLNPPPLILEIKKN